MKKEIFIDTAGREVRARLFEDEVLICNAVAKCHPEDEFDICTGAEIAIDRLKEKYKKVKKGDKYKQFGDGKFCIYADDKTEVKEILEILNVQGFTWADGTNLLDCKAVFYRDTYFHEHFLFRAHNKKVSYCVEPVFIGVNTKTVSEFKSI